MMLRIQTFSIFMLIVLTGALTVLPEAQAVLTQDQQIERAIELTRQAEKKSKEIIKQELKTARQALEKARDLLKNGQPKEALTQIEAASISLVRIREDTGVSQDVKHLSSQAFDWLEKVRKSFVEFTGNLELIVSGFLPAPVLHTGEARYILEITSNSSLPPEMVVGDKIGWSAGIYHVKGYLSGKTGDVWNSTSQRLEKTPVLTVLQLTKIRSVTSKAPDKTKSPSSDEQVYQWQIDAASKIDCWWQCTSQTDCSTGSLSVSPGTVVARRDDPEGKWVPPKPDEWTKVCGRPCRIVKVNFMDFSFGGECTLSNAVKK